MDTLSPKMSFHSTPFPGVLTPASSLLHPASCKLNRTSSPVHIPDLATSLALEPWNSTLTCPLLRRKRKSGSTKSKVRDLFEAEYGHKSATTDWIASVELQDGLRSAIGMNEFNVGAGAPRSSAIGRMLIHLQRGCWRGLHSCQRYTWYAAGVSHIFSSRSGVSKLGCPCRLRKSESRVQRRVVDNNQSGTSDFHRA